VVLSDANSKPSLRRDTVHTDRALSFPEVNRFYLYNYSMRAARRNSWTSCGPCRRGSPRRECPIAVAQTTT